MTEATNATPLGTNSSATSTTDEKMVKAKEEDAKQETAEEPKGMDTSERAGEGESNDNDSASEVEDESEHGDDEDDEGQDASIREDEKELEIPTRFTRSGRRRATPFPVKLMKVLSMKEFHQIINWTPSGKSFSILKPKLFTVEVLPTYFKSAKYSSFTRKLHRWGYMRHYRGPEAGAFYHKDFQRGELEMAEKMTCYKPEAMRPASSVTPKKPKSKSRKAKSESLGRSPMNSSGAVSQQSAMDAELAIELEVARRLRQRMDAAALNQRAQLAVMQQQQQIQMLQTPTFVTPMAHMTSGAFVTASPWDMQAAAASQAAAMPVATLNHAFNPALAMRGFGSPMAMHPTMGNMMAKPTYAGPSAALSFPFATAPLTNRFGAPSLHGAKSA